jgi:hypothetical protein
MSTPFPEELSPRISCSPRDIRRRLHILRFLFSYPIEFSKAAWLQAFTPPLVYTKTQNLRPGNFSCLRGHPPGIAKLIDYLLQRIDASRRNESLRQRPGSKVAQQMIEILRCCHFEHYINVIATEFMVCLAEGGFSYERNGPHGRGLYLRLSL